MATAVKKATFGLGAYDDGALGSRIRTSVDNEREARLSIL